MNAVSGALPRLERMGRVTQLRVDLLHDFCLTAQLTVRVS